MTRMDQLIYGRNRSDLGNYRTRRFPKGGNPAPHDPSEINSRNPSTVVGHFNSGALAPHATTTRWSYTVPPRRRAKVQGAIAAIARNVAAAALGNYAGYVLITRANGGGSFMLVYARTFALTAGTVVSMVQAGEIDLYEGDIMRGDTEDQNAGGTVSYTVSANAIEYDAEEKSVGFFAAELNIAGQLTGPASGGGASRPFAGMLGSSDAGLASGSKLYPY
jgi:hypothetical protein